MSDLPKGKYDFCNCPNCGKLIDVKSLRADERQQVGRELLEKSNRDNDSDIWDLIETIREVCKLENSDE